MLEKVSAALKTTPTTIPQTPHISKNPPKKKITQINSEIQINTENKINTAVSTKTNTQWKYLAGENF